MAEFGMPPLDLAYRGVGKLDSGWLRFQIFDSCDLADGESSDLVANFVLIGVFGHVDGPLGQECEFWMGNFMCRTV